MSTKYIPDGKDEIRLYRHNKAVKEKQRQTITDSSLIALRRVYLQHKSKSDEFEQIATKLNSIVKYQKQKQIIDIFSYYFSTMCLD